MEKTLFEQMGGTYEQQGDYLIPCLALPTEEEKPIGIFGQQHLRYLKEHRRIAYVNLLTSGKLNSYLADIDEQAQKMRFLFVRPEFCPSGDLSTPKIRLSSDSASRRTPLPLAKSSRYRATSGLSPYRTCAHRAHR